MTDTSSLLAEQELRCQQLLHEGTESALKKAVDAAHACLAVDETQLRGYLVLAEALSRLGRHEAAVSWFKKGVQSISFF